MSNSVCMEEGPRGDCWVIEPPVARRADRRERRIKNLADHSRTGRPWLDTLSNSVCCVECLVFWGLGVWGFGFVMHQTHLDTISWLFLKLRTLSLLNSSKKKIEKLKKIENFFQGGVRERVGFFF